MSVIKIQLYWCQKPHLSGATPHQGHSFHWWDPPPVVGSLPLIGHVCGTVAVWTQKKFFPLLIRPQGSQGCQKITFFFHKWKCFPFALRLPPKDTNSKKNMGCVIEGCGIVGCGIKGHAPPPHTLDLFASDRFKMMLSKGGLLWKLWNCGY